MAGLKMGLPLVGVALGLCAAATGAQTPDSIAWLPRADSLTNFVRDSSACSGRAKTLAGDDTSQAYGGEIGRCLGRIGWMPVRVVPAKSCPPVSIAPVLPLPEHIDSAAAVAASNALAAAYARRFVPSSDYLQTAHDQVMGGRVLLLVYVPVDREHLEARAERTISGPVLGDALFERLYMNAPPAMAGGKVARGIRSIFGASAMPPDTFEAIAVYDVACSPYRPLPLP